MKLFVLLELILWFSSTFGERILFMAPSCSKSHKISFMPFAEALAERGHHVTVVTPYKPKINHRNVHEIVLGDFFTDSNVTLFELLKESPITMAKNLLGIMDFFLHKGYTSLMENQEFQGILKSRDYDLVIVLGILNEYVLPIIDDWNIPRVVYFPTSGVTWFLAVLGVSREYASIPAGLIEYDDQMTFLQRAINMLSSEMFLLLRYYIHLSAIDELVKKDFPSARPVSEIEKDDVLVFVSHNLAIPWPRPFNPNVIPIGGLHLTERKPLPQDLQVFADGADQGLVIFTLGTTTPVSAMPKETADIFLKVFSKLPQRVVWKWEKTGMDNVPPNVKLLDWLPQQDLLRHPNTRVFITHGGMGGTQESLYNSVPILGIPFSGDQLNNIGRAVKEGWALKLSWASITEANLEDSIKRLVSDPSFRGNATRLSRLLRDEMMPAKDVAVYWVEHVLRHGGSKHLQVSSKNMPFYKYFLLDVFAFLFFIALVVLAITYFVFRWIWRRVIKRSKAKKE